MKKKKLTKKERAAAEAKLLNERAESTKKFLNYVAENERERAEKLAEIFTKKLPEKSCIVSYNGASESLQITTLKGEAFSLFGEVKAFFLPLPKTKEAEAFKKTVKELATLAGRKVRKVTKDVPVEAEEGAESGTKKEVDPWAYKIV